MNTPVNIEILHFLKDKSNLLNYTINKDESISFHNIPEIGDIVMWIYEKHGIWISVWRYRDYASACDDYISFKHNYSGSTTFKTPTEAYSSAILYILNNLVCK